MKILRTYMKVKNEIQNFHIKLRDEFSDDVHAVFIDGFSDINLDMDFGAGVDFEIADMTRFMANYRHSEYWCSPSFGTKASEIPDETQALIYEDNDGNFGVVLPVVSEKYKCVIKGNVDGTITARLFSWYDSLNKVNALAFVYAKGKNPFELMAKCAEAAMKILNNGCTVRKNRRYPEIFEYLGWCSWDAMEIRVNEDDLIAKCEEFKSKGIPVRWAIIDDMWAEVKDFYGMTYDNRPEMFRLMHSSKLWSFKADPIRFPNGLEHTIKAINDYDIKVGMWHPTTGYWMGADPDGEIYKEHKDCMIKTADGRYIHDYKKEKAYSFYAAFHDYLKKCGTEFVKIDNQSMTQRFFKNLAPVGEVASEFHKGMEASVGYHFDNNMINCMGMASEDMWNRPVSAISRCSDDFVPEDSAWFLKHITQCSYNGLVQGQFFYNDWDMWWSDDGQSTKNSILSAISGGPIYVSDELGRSRAEVFKPICLSDGRILRCDRPAMPTADCITHDPATSKNIFKVHNICGDSGVIAAFNINKDEIKVSGTISPSDIDGLKGDKFAVYEHFTKELKILSYDEKIQIELADINEFKLYVVVPIVDGFAPIGRTDKFVSPKTIKYVRGKEIELVENGEYAYVDNGELFFDKK